MVSTERFSHCWKFWQCEAARLVSPVAHKTHKDLVLSALSLSHPQHYFASSYHCYKAAATIPELTTNVIMLSEEEELFFLNITLKPRECFSNIFPDTFQKGSCDSQSSICQECIMGDLNSSRIALEEETCVGESDNSGFHRCQS